MRVVNETMRTTLLLAALTILLILFGRAAGGRTGVLTAFALASAVNFTAWRAGDRVVLSMMRARELPEDEAPEIHALVSRLAGEAGMPVPRLWLIPDTAPNALATGRDPAHASIAVTRGLVEMLNAEELEGVLAHELAHIRHGDTLTACSAATLAGAVTSLASMVRWSLLIGGYRGNRDSHPAVLFVLALVMPLAALMIRAAVSRSREFDADLESAALTGNALYLASALARIDTPARQGILRPASPAAAHLFIVNPLGGHFARRLFGTHPPVEERIARLEALERGA